jgi:nucleotidyltransferase substrate binding protein (TIGR01987 family)
MTLNIESLVNAFSSLKKAVLRAKKEPKDLEVRDACIQRFEYTFELSVKTIKRYIEMEMPVYENLDQMNYRDLMRIAFEIGLITETNIWFSFREARNQTSHAYDEHKAQAVFEVTLDFVNEAERLINQFQKRLK